VLVNSAFSRESIYRTYGRLAQVNYLGADLGNFKALNLPRENFVVSVGALAPHKGYDFLLRALAQIAPEQRPLLVIVCNQLNPPEHAFLTELARQLGVQVDFRQMVSEAELVRLYNTALFTVYAPVMEPFGFVPIESMACGTPVIGVREGGVRETIEHERTGLLVDRDPTLFAGAMRCLLQDANIRDRYGRQGRELVLQRWDWAKTVQALEVKLGEAAHHN
jgi:glycosyltransferase involved in cell wall biosynthesis